MKKYYLLLASFFFLAPLLKADFSDVPENHPSQKAIETLENLGIVQGYSDGTFGIDEPVNRAEFLKMAYLSESKRSSDKRHWNEPELFPFDNEESVTVAPKCFPDVDSEVWYAPYVCWGKQQGLIEGNPDGNFKPEQGVKLAEAAKILVETSGYPVKKYGLKHWAQGYIDALRQVPSSIESVDQVLTRSQVADLIYNYTLAYPQELDSRPSNIFIWDENKYLTFEFLGFFTSSDDLDYDEFSYDYLKKDGEIYYRLPYEPLNYKKFEDVDAGTFKVHIFYSHYKDSETRMPTAVRIGIATDQFGVFDQYQKRIEGSAGGIFKLIYNPLFYSKELKRIIGYGKDSGHAYLVSCYQGSVSYQEGCSVKILPESDADSFEVLGGRFSKDKNHIYEHGHITEDFDYETFQAIEGDLAMDKNGVYTFGELSDLDLEFIGTTYYYVGTEYYFTDGEKVYLMDAEGGEKEYTASFREVLDADPETFKVVQDDEKNWHSMALDNESLFVHGKKIENSSGGIFETIEEIDPPFGERYYEFARDNHHVYLVTCYEGCYLKILPNSDAGSFESLGGGYSKDENQVYYFDNILGDSYDAGYELADSKTFERLLPNNEELYCTMHFGRDDQSVFLNQTFLGGVNRDSFEFLDPYGFFFKDEDFVYRVVMGEKGPFCNATYWTILSEIDADSFGFFSPHHIGSKGKVYYVTSTGQISQIEGVDYDSFESLFHVPTSDSSFPIPYTKDKNNAYYEKQIITDLDVATLEYDPESRELIDKNGRYSWSDVRKKLYGN